MRVVNTYQMESQRKWLIYWLCLWMASPLDSNLESLSVFPNYLLSKISALVKFALLACLMR